MNTITAFEEDIKLQENFIKKFTPQKPFSKTYQKQMIFCGTGDSFAAGYLYAMLNGANAAEAASLGNHVGAAIVQVDGCNYSAVSSRFSL